MIGITGRRSVIMQEFIKLLPADETLVPMNVVPGPSPVDCDRYFFCQGLLYPKATAHQTDAEIEISIAVNLTSITKAIDHIVEVNELARICVMGSESGYRGSFDGTYHETKKSLHDYVTGKKLKFPGQQLVAVSPTIVRDAGMTLRRQDLDAVDKRAAAHPKGRFIESIEVARLVHFLLYQDEGYITGTVVRMHGATE